MSGWGERNCGESGTCGVAAPAAVVLVRKRVAAEMQLWPEARCVAECFLAQKFEPAASIAVVPLNLGPLAQT
jgi:hypothetical protein